MDKPSAFKNFINESVVKKIARAIKSVHPKFDSQKFTKIKDSLPPLELKERVLLITKELRKHLDYSFPDSLEILVKAMESSELKGFELWPFSEYISQFGLEHFDESMKAMYFLTQRFTSEFAVRPFILRNHTKVLKYFSNYSADKNVHVRRWVSEGSRPLLPWGQRIPLFVLNPTYTIPLLDKLKFDEELYVRKSVANHLNDISKNHPQVVIDVLKLWEKNTPEIHLPKIKWIKRHALRTLIKKGHPGALKLMGVSGKANINIRQISLNKKRFKLYDSLILSFEIQSKSNSVQKLIVDYAIDFIKSNGKQGRKIFKLKTLEIKAGETLVLSKKHSLKPITTMKYYSGTHHLFVQINGEIMGELKFFLEI